MEHVRVLASHGKPARLPVPVHAAVTAGVPGHFHCGLFPAGSGRRRGMDPGHRRVRGHCQPGGHVQLHGWAVGHPDRQWNRPAAASAPGLPQSALVHHGNGLSGGFPHCEWWHRQRLLRGGVVLYLALQVVAAPLPPPFLSFTHVAPFLLCESPFLHPAPFFLCVSPPSSSFSFLPPRYLHFVSLPPLARKSPSLLSTSFFFFFLFPSSTLFPPQRFSFMFLLSVFSKPW